MQLSVLSQIGLLTNFITLTISLAILLLTLWQGRQRTNVALSLFLLAVALNSVALMGLRLSDFLGTDPMPSVHTAATTSAFYSVLLYVFAAEFSGFFNAKWVRPSLAIAVMLGAIGGWLTWTGQTFEEVNVTATGLTQVEFTTPGLIILTLLLGYQVLALFGLLQKKNERGRSLIPGIALVIAASMTNALPGLRTLPLYGPLIAIATYWLGHAIVTEQLFNPLADLNRDLAEANKELARANKVKAEFMATMSHELRTPLNAVIGFSQMLQQGIYGELNEAQHTRISKILKSGQMLLHLINDVLDISKIEAGQMDITPERVALPELMDEIITLHEDKARAKELYLYHKIPDSVPPMMADPMRLRQIISNIVGNGVKFTKRGGVIVDCVVDERREQVTITITDTGIGISQEKLGDIFEEFRQADGSTTREYGGTGLGLAISRRLAQLHGGDITVESEEGQGSCFSIRLPLVAQVAAENA